AISSLGSTSRKSQKKNPASTRRSGSHVLPCGGNCPANCPGPDIRLPLSHAPHSGSQGELPARSSPAGFSRAVVLLAKPCPTPLWRFVVSLTPNLSTGPVLAKTNLGFHRGIRVT